MGTETRIGIVAGLLIVVVASVYFFYGSSRHDDDVLVATGPKVESLKIPTATDAKPTAPQKMPPGTPARLAPSAVKPSVVQHQPPTPTMPPGGSTANSSTPNQVGPPSDSLASGIDKYRSSVPLAPPISSANTTTPTVLRTGASPLLVEATKDNLKPIDKPGTLAGAPIKTGLNDTSTFRTKLEPDPIAKAPTTLAWPKKHIAVKSDTPASLAKHYYGDAKKAGEIVSANPRLKGRRTLKAGEEIAIPAPAVVSSNDSTTPTLVSELNGRTYVVQEGDTFYSIARGQLGDAKRSGELLKLNKDLVRGDPKRLRPGMTVKLPG